jgi:hypothetical protein
LPDPGIKCEKISVCFNKKSNLLLRFTSTSVSLLELLGAEDSFCE